MDDGIGPGRHGACGDLLPALLTLLGLLPGGILAPGREIQLVPALTDVVCDEPRDGCHTGIRGPYGLVRVAVIAGALLEAIRKHDLEKE
jgi:hypothetical protein